VRKSEVFRPLGAIQAAVQCALLPCVLERQIATSASDRMRIRQNVAQIHAFAAAGSAWMYSAEYASRQLP
jgi:hypothetical protein